MTARKRRLLTLIAAQVALLGIVFQVAALDHWSPVAIEGVRGVEQTDSHATHCHGAPAGCADGATAASWLNASPAAMPRPPVGREVSRAMLDVAPAETPPLLPFHPPRAA